MQHALGSAGTTTAGLMAATLARDGFSGAAPVLEGAQGMGVAMSEGADPAHLPDGLGSRWATAETSFNYHASCRHTHPAADALLQVMRSHGLVPSDLAEVVALVHQSAIDVLDPVLPPTTVGQAQFSIGTVLALVAQFGHAGLDEFDQYFLSPEMQTLRDKVRMAFDPEVDAAYPRRWIGKVLGRTTDGRELHGQVDEPKGDPGNSLDRDELLAKALRLARHSGGATEVETRAALLRLWAMAETPRVGKLLGAA